MWASKPRRRIWRRSRSRWSRASRRRWRRSSLRSCAARWSGWSISRCSSAGTTARVKTGELFLTDSNGELPMRRVVRGVSRVFRGEKPAGDLSETAGDYWQFRAGEAGLKKSNQPRIYADDHGFFSSLSLGLVAEPADWSFVSHLAKFVKAQVAIASSFKKHAAKLRLTPKLSNKPLQIQSLSDSSAIVLRDCCRWSARTSVRR